VSYGLASQHPALASPKLAERRREGCLAEATRGRRQAGALRRRTARQASAIPLVLTLPLWSGRRAPTPRWQPATC